MNTPKESALTFGRVAAMLPVSNMEDAFAFYSGLLKFQVSFRNGNPTGFAILQKDNAEIHLTLQPGHVPAKFNIAHMLVEDAHTLYEILSANGIRIIKGLQDKDYGLRAFVFEDPFGNRIDVGQKI